MSTVAGTTKKELRRPANTPFKQQKLKAWQPILTPKWVISTFFIVGIVFIPIGAVILDASNKIVETTIDYSDTCAEQAATCVGMDKYKLCECSVKFTLEKDMKAPVYVYYQLENYYQNHRRYVKSRSDQQLRGDFGVVDDSGNKISSPENTLDDCEPDTAKFFQNGTSEKYWYYPCGLIARSVFNDTFQLTGGPQAIDSGNPGKANYWTTGDFDYDSTTLKKIKQRDFWTDDKIAWESDIKEKFKPMPIEWMNKFCRNVPYQRTLDLPPERATLGPYFCWQDVTDPDFIVWMRTAGLPTFKKLYRIINEDAKGLTDGTLKAGEYTMKINNVYDVRSFKGKKSFVFSTTSWIGGRNVFLGAAYVAVGSVTMVLGAIFLAKHLISPRQLGDQRYLVWKK